MTISGNFLRINVLGGFALQKPDSGLSVGLWRGALVAQGNLYVPGFDPVPPDAPAGLAYLGYNHSGGLYWTADPHGNTAGDAVLGWAQTDGTNVQAVSSQIISVGSTGGGSGGSGIVGSGLPQSGAGSDGSFLFGPISFPGLA